MISMPNSLPLLNPTVSSLAPPPTISGARARPLLLFSCSATEFSRPLALFGLELVFIVQCMKILVAERSFSLAARFLFSIFFSCLRHGFSCGSIVREQPAASSFSLADVKKA
ncbi:hypothetical protein O6P43_029689 [Quillaja saponaria]|uniref:Uncharacterized protein n=1 Tax=Quillaja saponaria TaxID=32244 RepID=A0AAD7L0I3_QUISA|nr:hypothetical protein O6P43_029689 [Quillaja saponaria]